MEHSFRELDDLILHLKGLDMYAEAIDRLRDQLAHVVTASTLDNAAA